jgi:hypothetical protein
MKDCFHCYKDKYKKTHTLSLATGFGLTPEDQQTGIQTIEQKLNSLCPHYQAVHELMGNKAFVNPLYKVDAQKDVETTKPSDSDNSYDPDDSDDSDNSENMELCLVLGWRKRCKGKGCLYTAGAKSERGSVNSSTGPAYCQNMGQFDHMAQKLSGCPRLDGGVNYGHFDPQGGPSNL